MKIEEGRPPTRILTELEPGDLFRLVDWDGDDHIFMVVEFGDCNDVPWGVIHFVDTQLGRVYASAKDPEVIPYDGTLRVTRKEQ